MTERAFLMVAAAGMACAITSGLVREPGRIYGWAALAGIFFCIAAMIFAAINDNQKKS